MDNSATTRCLKEAADLMYRIYTEDYGNPSSAHRKGIEAESYLKEARETLAGILRCRPEEILFTSGGTESDNLAILGTLKALRSRHKNHIVTDMLEHPAVLSTVRNAEDVNVTYLPVDKDGCISVDAVEQAIREETAIVSIMHTNNEIGSLQPVGEIGRMLKKKHPGVVFHVDAVQGFGKARIYPAEMGIDLLSVSGHKIHGPKGVGFLYIRSKTRLIPIIHGGGQQGDLRSGTENVPGIAGMACAAKRLYRELDADTEKLWTLKTEFVNALQSMEGVHINGAALDRDKSMPHIVSASFEGVRAEVLLHALEEKGIYVSAGSACATHKGKDSSTLKSIGLGAELLDSTIRFSFSIETESAELRETAEALQQILPELRKYRRR